MWRPPQVAGTELRFLGSGGRVSLLADGPMEARNKEARRDSAVRESDQPALDVTLGFLAKGYTKSQFTLTAERVAFLVTGFHLMAVREVIRTAGGWLAHGWPEA